MNSLMLVAVVVAIVVSIKNFLDIEDLQVRIKKLENQESTQPAVQNNIQTTPSFSTAASTTSHEQVIEDSSASKPDPEYEQHNYNDQETYEEGLLEKLINWYKEDWLLKTGAILLVLAFGWFTSYAFANNWIIPEYRILLGLIFGFTSIIIGYLRFKKYTNQGIVFLILGITVVSGTVYAANAVFDFISPLTGLLVIILASALISIISYNSQNRLLTSMNLVVSSFAPILAGSLELNASITVLYLLAIFLGVAWLSIRNDWHEIPFIILIAAVVYSPIYLLYHNSFITLFFVLSLFTLVFAISFIRFLTVKSDTEDWKDSTVSILNTIFLVLWIF